MDNERNIRINKVLRELNISLEKAINILNCAGVAIESNPNSKISKNEYDFLVNNIVLIEKIKGVKRDILVIPQITTASILSQIRNKKGNPSSVFKYMGTENYHINSLRESYIFYSNFNDFNDPFDCSPELISFFNLLKNKKIRAKEFQIKQNFNSVGICCFSRNLNSILMWSHYANNHKGFCLEFNINSDGTGLQPLDVHYTTSFAKAEFYKEKQDSLFNMIYTKSENWQYESEMRSLQSGFTDKNSRKVPFSKSSLKAIYIGVKCDGELKEELYKIIKEVYNNSIDIFEGSLSSNSFEILWKKTKIK